MGEFRREHIPEAESMAQSTFGKSSTLTYDRAQDVRTGYAELRAPLVPTDARFIPIRGLELQLAGRRDDVRMTVPDNRAVAARATRPFTARRRADVYTVGARVLPRSWLMLRASLATGQTPPALQYLQERTVPVFEHSDNFGHLRFPFGLSMPQSQFRLSWALLRHSLVFYVQISF